MTKFLDGPTTANRPRRVCLCGSTRFRKAFLDAQFRETMAGKIVLSVDWFSHADGGIYAPTAEEKAALDRLHLWKIDLADEVLVINVLQPWCPSCQMYCFETDGRSRCCDQPTEQRGYIGDSTRREIAHAQATNKPVRYLETFHG